MTVQRLLLGVSCCVCLFACAAGSLRDLLRVSKLMFGPAQKNKSWF